MSEIKVDNTKYQCVCGSHIKNSQQNIAKHLTSKKHIEYIQNLTGRLVTPVESVPEMKKEIEQPVEKKNKDPTANALRVKAFRERQKAKLGEEKYKEFMRIEKMNTRTVNKAKKDVKVVSEGGVVKASRKEEKESKEQVAQYVAEIIGDLATKKVYNKPAVTQLVKERIQRYDSVKGGVENCDQLIDNLDKNNLVNSKYGKIKAKSLQDYLRNIKLVYKYMTGNEFDCTNFNFARDTKAVYKAVQEMPRERKQQSGNQETTLSTKTK